MNDNKLAFLFKKSFKFTLNTELKNNAHVKFSLRCR